MAVLMSAPVQANSLDCLTQVIYHEARGEPKEGKVAVAWVVMNRVADKRFAGSVCQVVWAKGQFSEIGLRKFDKGSSDWADSKMVAEVVLSRKVDDPTQGGLYFMNKRDLGVVPKWVERLRFIRRIGDHWFYGDR